jgi:hypothetical protein
MKTLSLIIICVLSFFGCKSESTNNTKIDKVRKYNLPYFGEINLNSLKDIEKTIVIAQSNINLNLNFYEDNIELHKLENVNLIIKELDSYIHISNKKINEDFLNKGLVYDYYEHHQKYDVSKIKFFEELKLTSIEFYPEEDEHYVKFEFTIGKKITDYIISVRFNKNLQFDSIDFIN